MKAMIHLFDCCWQFKNCTTICKFQTLENVNTYAIYWNTVVHSRMLYAGALLDTCSGKPHTYVVK